MAWYQVKGAESDTVISSRIRFARNIEGLAFGEKLRGKDATSIIDRVGAALGPNFIRADLGGTHSLIAESLVESHLVSREFAAMKTPHALFRNDNESVYVMTPEEDHIRLQCILPGLALYDAFRIAAHYDDLLGNALPLAFDEKLGYLTHCPTNLGTGMRASVMLFLPALTRKGQISSLAHQLSKAGLTIRGIYGEGSDSRGCLYQISNQVTLGISEEDILNKLTDFVQSIITAERRERGALTVSEAEDELDRISRSEGILRYATSMSSEEFFSLYTNLKLGIAKGIVTSISEETLNTLLINILPATLTLGEKDPPKNEKERDRARATFIKRSLEVLK